MENDEDGENDEKMTWKMKILVEMNQLPNWRVNQINSFMIYHPFY